ncbi:MAG: redoxin domain-containing protein [Acidimicrobiia bacterium]|nr:redoxin domain-containing protein [Acidimicrobiia bacterium]
MTEADVAVEQTPDTPERNLRLWITTGVAAVAFIILAIVFNSRFGVDPRVIESPLVGLPAPNVELAFVDQEGTLAIADLRGDVVVVNFFASWCIPACRDEHPHLTAAAADYADRGVRFVGIATNDKPADTMGFLDRYGWGTNYSYLDDPDSRAGVEFGTFGVPETFVIDRAGLVTHKFTGPVTYDELAAELNRVLAGTGS